MDGEQMKTINPATQAKQRWNTEHYTQVKISVAPDLAAAFKAACASSNVSIAGKLSEFMAKYSNVVKKDKSLTDYTTRRHAVHQSRLS